MERHFEKDLNEMKERLLWMGSLAERVVHLLALHQLMAIDLRFVLAVSRINNDLERIGDQAVNIAQGALRILRHPRVKPYVDLPRMSDLVEEMLRNALNAVV